jgi:hypothetical protein
VLSTSTILVSFSSMAGGSDRRVIGEGKAKEEGSDRNVSHALPQRTHLRSL